MSNKLFVGGLSWGTTDDKLRDFFAGVGTVVSANVITDKYTGKSRGFGFVEMSSDDEAKKAIDELNGKQLDERTIVVNEAKPQAPRSDNFGARRNDRNDRNWSRNRGGRRGY